MYDMRASGYRLQWRINSVQSSGHLVKALQYVKSLVARRPIPDDKASILAAWWEGDRVTIRLPVNLLWEKNW
jgi:hypothetical protein